MNRLLKHRFPTSAVGLALLMALFYAMQIGLLLENNNLVMVSIANIIILIFLTSALYWIQEEKPNKFLSHLYKGIALVLLAFVVYIPMAIVSIFEWNLGLIDNFEVVAFGLPKLISDVVIKFLVFVPKLLVAALICWYLHRRKETKDEMKVSEHLIEH